MNKYYEIAGIKVAITGEEEIMHQNEGVLQEFASENIKPEYNYEIKLVGQVSDILGTCIYKDSGQQVYESKEGIVCYKGPVSQSNKNAYYRILSNEKNNYVEVKNTEYNNRINFKTILDILQIEHYIILNSGLILHASYISYNGKAILFTAPSGTGKSTQADLWERLRGAEIINGDRAVFKKTEDGFVACGLPFAGSSKICKNVTLPLVAVVYLGQAPTTSIERLTGVEAFKKIWEGCSINTWNEKDVKMASELVTELVTTVPVYHLSCTPDETAVIALEEVL